MIFLSASSPSKKLSDSDVPYKGEPGSHSVSNDGTKERVYGPDGLPDRDRHHTDHGHPKQHPDVPHDHDWGYNDEGVWAPGTAYPSPEGELQPRFLPPVYENIIPPPNVFEFNWEVPRFSWDSPSTGDESFQGKLRDFIDLFS